MFNARIGADFGRVNLSVFAQNLFNNHVQLARFRDITSSPLNYGSTFRPRTVGVTATFNR
jgi:hypothetical protein